MKSINNEANYASATLRARYCGDLSWLFTAYNEEEPVMNATPVGEKVEVATARFMLC